MADYYERHGELEKAAELSEEEVEEPVDVAEAHEPLKWADFARLVRVLNTAYPQAEPLDLTPTRLFKMILQLPGFADNPDAVGEEQLEKIQMAWHEIQTG
ncbi:MAG: Fe-S cluster assembly protein IscX [Anaerolineae bacterium]